MTHPAVTKSKELSIQLEESRVLREKDRQKYEMQLAEAEGSRSKLLRQVGGAIPFVYSPGEAPLRTTINKHFIFVCSKVERG